jgi:cell division GTPase FtsZ
MKLLVIGCGQCGGRIADEFAKLNLKSHVQRKIDIATGIFAVNTDVADLSGLSNIKRDFQHRILIGNQRTGGHGVGKINELAADIAKEDSDKIVESIRSARLFPETDAFLLIASAAGGTGSGAIATLTQHIKERYLEKPVYNMLILPFQHEEMTEERTIYNTATCLKSTYLVADAVFLVDNQRYVRKNFSLRENLKKINTMVVEPFYDLLCTGEEHSEEYIGAKILDAGDIIQTLTGWTVIGHGKAPIKRWNFFSGKKHQRSDFLEKSTETHRGVQALQGALGELSLKCSSADARKAMYLVSGPAKELNMDLVRGLGSTLKQFAHDAIIRSGDYPRGNKSVDVTVILSDLVNVNKVISYFNKTINYIRIAKSRRGISYEQQSLENVFKDIPSLL